MAGAELLGWWLWAARFSSDMTLDIKPRRNEDGRTLNFALMCLCLYTRSVHQRIREWWDAGRPVMLGTHAVNAYAQHQWSHGLLADAFCALCASAARDRDE